ncbi:MAG: hypothetical protein WBY94_00050 [Polyangiaceae bacterium]
MRARKCLIFVLGALALIGSDGKLARAADADPDPHGHAHGGGGMPGVFDPPQDVEEADPALAQGTIAVDLRDADDAPVPGESITLGILVNSIAKGDSRKHLQATTDGRGRAVFAGLETASNIAYRVSSGYQGGAFAASPFQLEHAKAMHVVLHVYPVTRDLQTALVVVEATIAAEVREDRLQVEEIYNFYNLGRTAWQPDGVTMSLPDGFTAFNAPASMSDQGFDEVGGAARLRGTFAPGRHVVEFRWQLPMSGSKEMNFDVGLAPHIAVARAVMPAAAEIQLRASGFPPSEIRHDGKGQRFLVTERRMRPEDPKLTRMSISIDGLPTPGPERLVATLLAAVGVAAGLAFSFSRRADPTGPDSEARSALLDELGELERARLAGQVGPKTYERIRRELVDALAYTLVDA